MLDAKEAAISWPSHTNLIQGPSGKYGLTVQNHEVKVVIRKAIPQVLFRIAFINFFPSSDTQEAWSRKALITSARSIAQQMAPSSNSVAMRYDAVKQRLKKDDEYAPILSRLVRRTHTVLFGCD